MRWGSLTEKDYRRKTLKILKLKEEYLRELAKLERDQTRKRVYLDESYIHRNYSFTKGWFIPSEGRDIFKPFGLGPRIAIIGAITQDSWLGSRPQNIRASLSTERSNSAHQYRSIKYWQVKDKEEEGNVDYDVFKDYFENCVIPYLTPNSIIILDNASYHRCYSKEVFRPKQSSRKEELVRYIESQGEKIVKKTLKPELLTKAKRYFQGTKTEIQEIGEKFGHTVLYLPPYHPELNPIEFAWGRIKKTAGEAATFDLNKLANEVLPEAFAALTLETITNIFNHVKTLEEEYRQSMDIENESVNGQSVDENGIEDDNSSIYDDDSNFSEREQEEDDDNDIEDS